MYEVLGAVEHRLFAQEARDAIREIQGGTFDEFSLPALKVSWNVAKGLPPPPYSAIDAPLDGAGGKLKHVLAGFDCTRPLVVDVGCGFGSFARAMAMQAQAVDRGTDAACAKRANAPPLLPGMGCSLCLSTDHRSLSGAEMLTVTPPHCSALV